jgi:hypothetical protein
LRSLTPHEPMETEGAGGELSYPPSLIISAHPSYPLTPAPQTTLAPDRSSSGSASRPPGLLTLTSSPCPTRHTLGTMGPVTVSRGSMTPLAPQASLPPRVPTQATSQHQSSPLPSSRLPRSLQPNRKLAPKGRPSTAASKAGGPHADLETASGGSRMELGTHGTSTTT